MLRRSVEPGTPHRLGVIRFPKNGITLPHALDPYGGSSAPIRRRSNLKVLRILLYGRCAGVQPTERTQERFDIKPEPLAGDTAYGSGANLNWLVKDKDIAPHIPVIDKSKREDGTFSREDFTFDKDRNVYICPANKILTTTGKLVNDGETLLYRTKARDCRGCLLKAQCCPKTSVRKIPRSIYEEARDVARALARTEAFKQSSRDRKRVEMLFAHLKRILRLGRLRLRGPCGAQFEFTLAAIAQNLRRLAKLVARPPPFAPLRAA